MSDADPSHPADDEPLFVPAPGEWPAYAPPPAPRIPPHLRADAVVTRVGGRRGPRRERRQRGAFLPGLGVVATLLLVLALIDPQGVTSRFDALVRSAVAREPQGQGHYTFMFRQPNGQPVAYEPCTPIDYVVNPQGAPADYTHLVSDAVAQVSRASGFTFHDAGTTTSRDWTSRTPGPVVILWAEPSEVTALAGDVVGEGGSAYVSLGNHSHYITGGVALDQDSFADLARTGQYVEERAILMHELGHVLGLGHVHDGGELMNADNIGRTSFGKGDLAGFAALRGTRTC